MATAPRHRELSSQLLAHAREELRRGDTIQAAEKAWGAVAHYVKFVANENDWPQRTHRQLLANANKLIQLTPDYELNTVRLSAVRQLHQNFYEDDLDADEVAIHIAAAEDLLDALGAAKVKLPDDQ